MLKDMSAVNPITKYIKIMQLRLEWREWQQSVLICHPYLVNYLTVLTNRPYKLFLYFPTSTSTSTEVRRTKTYEKSVAVPETALDESHDVSPTTIRQVYFTSTTRVLPTATVGLLCTRVQVLPQIRQMSGLFTPSIWIEKVLALHRERVSNSKGSQERCFL